MTARTRRLTLLAILIASAALRLHHLNAPMADALQAKQVYVANKARSIAREPINPLRNTLDFLDERGERLPLIEEVPLYTGLLGLGYRVFGERDWVGHALSLVGSLVAIAAFFDLVRREKDDRAAIAATILLSASPLFLFYGRAVLPDPWMLAGMLTSAACYRRYLDGGGRRWLVLAGISGSIAALFKYFGLMVAIPLMEMTRRKSGSWRSALSPSFLAMMAVMAMPTFVWMALVFVRSPNPVKSGWSGGGAAMPYLIVQAPEVLLAKPFWAGLLGRFPWNDCGAIAAVLMGVGVVSTMWRRSPIDGSTLSWTIMGLLFYLLLGPKLRDHDYYELMMLPAAALWAVRGLDALGVRLFRSVGLPAGGCETHRRMASPDLGGFSPPPAGEPTLRKSRLPTGANLGPGRRGAIAVGLIGPVPPGRRQDRAGRSPPRPVPYRGPRGGDRPRDRVPHRRPLQPPRRLARP